MTAPITVDRITLHNQALAIDAYLARPTAPGSYPGIIVFQEIFGVNAHIRDVADRLAREGYIAIAPALYQRSQPGFEVGYTADDMAIGRQYKDATRADELIGDTRAAIAYLETIDGYNGNLGTIGFCFGGHVAYLIATLPEIKATASFYGAGIPVFCPGEADPTVSRTPQIQGEIYCFFGMADPLIPAEQNAAVEAALQQAKIKHRVFRYPGVDHGFFCDRRDSYNAEAAKAAWNEVKALFGRLQ
jgi:carboxymethylenebutenolidase